jgi:hypothetical protein
MAKGEASEQVILQLRAVLRGISPLIWRRLLVPSDASIAQLHDVLQVAFGWDDMHLHRFEIRGREYGLSREGGMFFDTDARKVRIGDLKLRRMERFTYEYDFGDSWVHDIRIEATLPIDPAKESGPFRVLGDLRPAFSRSHVRRKPLIGGTAGLFSARRTVIDRPPAPVMDRSPAEVTRGGQTMNPVTLVTPTVRRLAVKLSHD